MKGKIFNIIDLKNGLVFKKTRSHKVIHFYYKDGRVDHADLWTHFCVSGDEIHVFDPEWYKPLVFKISKLNKVEVHSDYI